MRSLRDGRPLSRLASAVLLAAMLFAVVSTVEGRALESSIAHDLSQAEHIVASEAEQAIQRGQKLLNKYGYSAVFGVIFLEGIGIPAPGEMLVIAAVIEASRGSLNLAILLAVTVAAAVLGNSAGYAIGRFGGNRLLRRLPISEDRLAKVSALFDRYGGWFILLARFIDGPRQLNGIIAGTLKMPWWEFTFWNVAGAALWVGIWAGTAYWFGHDIKSIINALQPIESILLGALAVMIAAGLLYLLWRLYVARQTSPPH